tara:strand:- start:75 stop:338 length:264 start_codon:yes stop_codon:yes gene_type:complete
MRTDDSNTHTTASEINFLRAAPMLIAERRFQKKPAEITPMEVESISDAYLVEWYTKYIEASKKRVGWQEMNQKRVLAEAHVLLKKYQ